LNHQEEEEEEEDRLYDEPGTQGIKSRATLSCCPLRIYIRATQRNSITLTGFKRVGGDKYGKGLYERKLNLE